MRIYNGDLKATHFMNVDLDVSSRFDLQPLVSALGKRVRVYYLERVKRTYRAALAVEKPTKDADSTILAFCELIQSLSEDDLRHWQDAKTREFNIGIQAGVRPHDSLFLVEAETLKTVAAIGGCIGVTVYPPEQSKRKGSASQFLSVDLDMQSRFDLQPLVSALATRAYALHAERLKRTYHASFELETRPKDVDGTIRAFCNLIQRVPAAERQHWHDAKIREFNIGIQAGKSEPAGQYLVKADTVKSVAALDARIGITVYRPEPVKRAKPC